jgi:hypothetical protein
MREENFNVLKCEICKTTADYTFRNIQIDKIRGQVDQSKEVNAKILKWIQTLSKYHPELVENQKGVKKN